MGGVVCDDVCCLVVECVMSGGVCDDVCCLGCM